jgi:pyruvate,water dikinase
MHPEPFARGFQELTEYYGLLFNGLVYEYINGFAYSQMRPLEEHEIPGRIARAQQVIDGQLWREQLREWDEIYKPQSIAKHRELQEVSADALTDEELAAYLRRCREHHADMIFQHMRFTGAAMIAVGDFLAHAGDWTDVPPAELLGMMRGAAPVSAGASDELHAMIDAIKADPEASALLESDGEPGEVLESLRTMDNDAGRAVSAYLDVVGYRLLDGFDIAGRYALELPEALLLAIRAAIENPVDDAVQAEVEAKISEVRGKVPEEHRHEFDRLLDEARLMYRIRDERGVFSDIWASGIMRRAALAAGRRLADRGRIQDPEHIVDATTDEMCAMVLGTNGPSADELAERFATRSARNAKQAPPTLGPPAPPPPDPSGLPPAAARLMRAMGLTINALFAPSEAPHEEEMLRGLAARGGVYEGPARRVSGPADFDRIVKGDVLLTESTTEAFNILLPLLGAIVTDSGGLLSHSAIVAREYGIPGVVGTRDATDRIADGARVRVDGDAGEVTVLD